MDSQLILIKVENQHSDYKWRRHNTEQLLSCISSVSIYYNAKTSVGLQPIGKKGISGKFQLLNYSIALE